MDSAIDRPAKGVAAVVYVRMAPALREALRNAAAANGVSLNASAVHALGAAAGPDFLRDVSQGGKPKTIVDDRRVPRRPEPSRMGSLAAEYISYWVDRQGIDRLIEIGRRSKDHDVVGLVGGPSTPSKRRSAS